MANAKIQKVATTLTGIMYLPPEEIDFTPDGDTEAVQGFRIKMEMGSGYTSSTMEFWIPRSSGIRLAHLSPHDGKEVTIRCMLSIIGNPKFSGFKNLKIQ